MKFNSTLAYIQRTSFSDIQKITNLTYRILYTTKISSAALLYTKLCGFLFSRPTRSFGSFLSIVTSRRDGMVRAVLMMMVADMFSLFKHYWMKMQLWSAPPVLEMKCLRLWYNNIVENYYGVWFIVPYAPCSTSSVRAFTN